MKITLSRSLLLILFSIGYSTEFSVQGVLRDPLGRTVTDGQYSVTFRIYEEASGGEAEWTETHGSVDVQHGVFTVLLGSVTDMSGLPFNTTYWLGITVEQGVEMTPRTQLTTSPYSRAVFGTDNVFPSVGRIGVGTTEPEAAFHVKNKNDEADETDIFLIENSEGEPMVKITSDGEVGVGTPAPGAAIHIVNDGDDKLLVTGSDGTAMVKITSDGNLGINDPPNYDNALSVKGNIRLHGGGVVQFDDGTSLGSANYGGSATAVAAPGSVNINAGEGGSGSINFNISANQKVTISNEGNVGIGTSSPDAPFEVEVPSDNSGVIAQFIRNGTVGLRISGNNGWTNVASSYALSLSANNATGSAYTSHLLINSSGYVGIGTPSPSSLLHVHGDMRANILYDNDNTDYYLNPAGTSITNDMRAVIFYDLEDSGFYVDANSSSVLKNIYTSYIIDRDGTGTLDLNGTSTFNPKNSSSSSYHIFIDNDGDHEQVIRPGTGNYGYLGNEVHYWYKVYYSAAYDRNRNTLSDRNLKENIRDLDSEDVLRKLMTLRGVRYDAKQGTILYDEKDPASNENIMGVIAQEVEAQFPEVGGGNWEDHRTVQYDRFVPIFIESIKQIKKEKDQEIETLRKEYDSKISSLLARVEALENQ